MQADFEPVYKLLSSILKNTAREPAVQRDQDKGENGTVHELFLLLHFVFIFLLAACNVYPFLRYLTSPILYEI